MYKLRKFSMMLVLCFCFSLFGTFAGAAEADSSQDPSLDDALFAIEITVDESGEISQANLIEPKNGLMLFGQFVIERSGDFYDISVRLMPGGYNRMVSAGFYVDYGDGTTGYYTCGSSSSYGGVVYATTSSLKYYSPGTYYISVGQGTIYLEDVLHEVVPVTDLYNYIAIEQLTVS